MDKDINIIQLDNDICERVRGKLSNEAWDQLISKIYLNVWDDVRNATYYQLRIVRRHIRNEVILRTVSKKIKHTLNEAI